MSLVSSTLSSKRGSEERESPFEDQQAQLQKKKSIVVTYMDLPTPLRVHTLNYVGETQEELRTLTVLSKKFNEDCKQTGIKWKIIPTIIISSLEHNYGKMVNLFRSLRDKNRLLQQYRLLIVQNVHKFYRTSYGEDNEIDTITNTFRIEILSLDLSLSSPPTTYCSHDFPYHLSIILPNLQEVNLSCTNFDYRVIREFSERCPRLEKIMWNNIRYGSDISVNGEDMQLAHNLRLLIVDDSVFGEYNIEKYSNLINHQDTFLFHKCYKVLERLSIRKAKYGNVFADRQKQIPQDALIKFVRNAPPSLKWFRSDLTKQNMDILRLERPGIELLS